MCQKLTRIPQFNVCAIAIDATYDSLSVRSRLSLISPRVAAPFVPHCIVSPRKRLTAIFAWPGQVFMGASHMTFHIFIVFIFLWAMWAAKFRRVGIDALALVC
jgi:hypothetical protein